MIIRIPQTQPGDEKIYKQHLFAAGENHITILQEPKENEPVTIVYRYTGDNSILILLSMTDALRRMGVKEINLAIPYFPGARQDRVCNNGEALTVKIYANLINSQKYNKVVVFDPHSEVTPALIDNVQVVDNLELVKFALRDIETFYRDELVNKSFFKDHFYTSSGVFDSEKYKTPLVLISPDAGAAKKVLKLSNKLGGLEVVRADKTRD